MNLSHAFAAALGDLLVVGVGYLIGFRIIYKPWRRDPMDAEVLRTKYAAYVKAMTDAHETPLSYNRWKTEALEEKS